MSLRRVIVSKMKAQPKQPGDHRVKYALEPVGEALFHQFGYSYEEFDSGPANFTTAVVEWPDGQIESVVADHIKFVEPSTPTTKEQGS